MVIAGSIGNTERLDRIKEYDPWAFMIGTAFCDKEFVKDGSLRAQIEKVLEYMDE